MRVPKLQIPVYNNSQEVCMELNTATGGNFLSQQVWKKLGKPDLQKSSLQFQSSNKHLLPVLGTFVAQTTPAVKGNKLPIFCNVTKISNLNLGQNAITSLNISIDKILLCSSSTSIDVKSLSLSSDEQSLQLRVYNYSKHVQSGMKKGI